MHNQKTIKKEIEFSGVGLHTGLEVNVKLIPAKANTGIIFRRVDLKDAPDIPVNPESISVTARRTVLKKGKAEVNTVEHLLSAAYAFGLDNFIVEISSAEMPAMDGSALEYFKLLKKTGIKELSAKKEVIAIKEKMILKEGLAAITALPSGNAGLRISYTLSYDHPFIGTQAYTYDLDLSDPENFGKEIAPARTFCLFREVELLRNAGFGKGANTQNTLVINEEGVLENELRFPDEMVRHKILDLIGDLAVTGKVIQGHIIAYRSGHSLNSRLTQWLLDNQAETIDDSPGDNENYDVKQILRILPHRYPFLMIDRIIELQRGKKVVGIKNVSFNEPYFQGHFPGQPIMPGVLQLEAMAQVSGILLLKKRENDNKLAYVISMDKVRFRRTVIPGDQMRIEATAKKLRGRLCSVIVKATVDSKPVAEAEMKFMMIDAEA